MFLLPSIVLGLMLGVGLGGRPSRLSQVRFRRPWLVAIALAVQLLAFTHIGAAWPATLRDALHIASYVLLLAFAASNVRLRMLWPALLGVTLNGIAIVANGGSMPVSRSAARIAGVDPDGPRNVSPSATHLRFLGDLFAVPGQLPIGNTFSVGDVLIGLGTAAFIAGVSLRRSGGGSGQDAQALEARADPRDLLVVRLDER